MAAAASDDGSASALPVVDLAPFFVDDEGGVARGRATEAVREACLSSGFFRVVNHGMSRELMARALELQALFFALPDEEKAKVQPDEGNMASAPLPAGYARQPAHSVDKNEFLLVLHPRLWPNLYPAEAAGFRKALVECHAAFTGLGLLLQEILNEGMGLPRGFLREYNDDRTFDFISARHGFPATEDDSVGTRAHQDVGCITFVMQDGVGGLEVLRPDGGGWDPVAPVEGSIVVNVGDVVQVLSNDRFKSATHRVVRKPAAHRYSLIFFFNVHGDKWVEPLPEFAGSEAPRYRGFRYGEYLKLRGSKTRSLSRPEDVVDITHYAI